VLIVRIGAMGDVLHAMPAVVALRERHPDWFIGWAIEPGWSELLEVEGETSEIARLAGRDSRRPLVDLLCEVPTRDWKRRPFSQSTLGDIARLRRELRRDEYDVCVDMQGALKSAIVGRMAGTQVYAGPAKPREAQARWFYKQEIATKATHVVEQGCELLGGAVGETLRPAKVTLPIDPAAERWCDATLSGIGERFAMIAPTAGWGAKQWPAERYGAVAAALGRAGYRTLVNEALGDRLADGVIGASEGFAKVVPCSVEQLIALTRRASVVIAGDTGPLHLAAALERPVVGLYGPTDPARNGPYGTVSCVLRHASSKSDHSRHQETEAGLMQITTDEVVEAALELLRTGQDKVIV
jgi:heptosyltransferase-1